MVKAFELKLAAYFARNAEYYAMAAHQSGVASGLFIAAKLLRQKAPARVGERTHE